MDKPAPEFTKLIDLASERLGGQTLLCSDDFFAPMENLLKQGRGVFIEDKYTDHGKWMDGWESRRKRTSGHDWCILKLGASGVIKGFDIDTNHFLGNHPPHAAVDAICTDEDLKNEELQNCDWKEILPRVDLDPGSQHFFDIDNENKWTHLKLNIYPDGGVARFKVYGNVYKNWDLVSGDDTVDLAAAENGGRSVLCNDMFFSHMGNLIMPGRSDNMGDGWETKRNRDPENVDWVMIKLAHPGTIKKIIVDTNHFKGNYPDTFSLELCYKENGDTPEYMDDGWEEVLTRVKLEAHEEHEFITEIKEHQKVNYAKLKIYPDGGVSRLRLFGNIVK
ncbi:MAG: allantoicase [Bacteroidetes bacterium]|nr:allantoicase [Bacteroidia bacterium]PCH68982.1 MAG: allantoicase [Bacteroidota bacterium]